MLNISFALWGYANFPDASSYVRMSNDDYTSDAFALVDLGDKIGYILNVGNLLEQWAIGDVVYISEYDAQDNELSKQKVVLGDSPQKVPFDVINGYVLETSPVHQLGVNVAIRTDDEVYEIVLCEDRSFIGAAWTSYDAYVPYTLVVSPGLHTIYAKVKDQYGSESRIVSIQVTLEVSAPTNASIFIKEGHVVINPNINLVLAADNADEMIVSVDSSFINASWQTYATEIPFILMPGVGTKVVYARFRNIFKQESKTVLAKTYLTFDIGVPSAPELLSPDGGVVSNMPLFEFKNKPEDGVLKYIIELSTNDFAESFEPFYSVDTYATFNQFTQKNYFQRQYTNNPWRPRMGDWTWNDAAGKLVYIPSNFIYLTKTGSKLMYDDLKPVNTELGKAIQIDNPEEVRSFYVIMDLETLSDYYLESELNVIESWLTSIVKPRTRDSVIKWQTLHETYNEFVEWEVWAQNQSVGYSREHHLNMSFVIGLRPLVKYATQVGFENAINKINQLVAVFDSFGYKLCFYSDKNFAESCVNYDNNYLLTLEDAGHEIGTYIELSNDLVDEREKIDYILHVQKTIDKLGVKNNVGVTGGWQLKGWEELYPSMQFLWTFGYVIPSGFRYGKTELWSSPKGYPGGTTVQFRVPQIMELPPQTYKWRVKAYNGFEWSSYSESNSFRVGRYTEKTEDWNFLVSQDYVKVYWSSGMVTTENDILFIKEGININPILYPVDGYNCTPNAEWWMVVQKQGNNTLLSLDNWGIRFCNKDDLPNILNLNVGWIPVLFFADGVSGRTPAAPSAYVTTTADNLPIMDTTHLGDKSLRDHANNQEIHGANVEIFDLPLALRKTVFMEDTRNIMFDLLTLPQPEIIEQTSSLLESLDPVANLAPPMEPTPRNKSIVMKAQGWGIGIIGIDNTVDLSDVSLAGTGAFAKGENYDVVLKNGIIISRSGTAMLGKRTKPTQLNVVAKDKPGLMA